MGRWSLDVYQVYCRMSFEAALAVGATVASSAVVPVAEAFHEEHLELLPNELGEFRRAYDALAADEVFGGAEDAE